MSFYCVLVGTADQPLYEAHLTSTRNPPSAATIASPAQSSFSVFGAGAGVGPSPSAATGGRSSVGYGPSKGRHVQQLIAHAALDTVEDVQWSNGYMYLKSIERFHEWNVSAWVTPGGVKMILLHDVKADDPIRLFLHATWEAYVKALLNPFHELNAPIKSPAFDARVREAAKKHL